MLKPAHLFAALALVSAAAHAQSQATYEPVRSVLGLTIERGEVDYRVTAEAQEAATTICSGTLRECEAGMIEHLERRYGAGNFNVKVKTLGGPQFWADEYVFAGWRIQKNVFTKNHRLLDPDHTRRAWGSYQGCRVAFEKVRHKENLRSDSDKLVVLLHGLGRSHHSLALLAKAFRDAGYQVAAVNYPSTRGDVHTHAAQVGRVLDRHDGVTEVSFVTFSFGGLVVRAVLARDDAWKQRLVAKRLVMVGPPNQGSDLAAKLNNPVSRMIVGEALTDLTPERAEPLPVPSIPFAVIAGGNGSAGRSAILADDDDGIVRVEATRLPGMSDFLRVDQRHRSLKQDPRVIAAAVSFVTTGSLAR